MVRIILGVTAGFVVWSIVWLAGNAGLNAAGLLPPPDTVLAEPVTLLGLLSASVLASVLAGLCTAWLARAPGHKPTLWLGLVLLMVGGAVQSQYWALMPLWYHLAFLLLLVPACLAGSRLRPDNLSKPTPLRDRA